MTSATHMKTDDDQHAVLLSALHVLVEQNGRTWFAQGIEIDYAASGVSLEDVQERFERGLRKTIEANLARHGGIERLLKYAPADVRERFQAARKFKLDHYSVFDLSDKLPASFPFQKLVFAERQPTPAHC